MLPGHGTPVRDHRALIDTRIAHHRQRRDRLAALIAERPRTARDLAIGLWGDTAFAHSALTISEILSHVDLLLNDGAVVEVDDGDGVIRFADAKRRADHTPSAD